MSASNIVSLVVVFTLAFLVFYIHWAIIRFFKKFKEDILEILDRLGNGVNRSEEDVIEITKEGEVKNGK